MFRSFSMALILCCSLPLVSIAASHNKTASLFQVSTGTALSAGLFHGAQSFDTLHQKGDFGLGSVADMDGEFVGLDGDFYRISPDGKVHLIPDQQTTPYAVVTHFQPKQTFQLDATESFTQLVEKLNHYVTNRNIPYAIKMTGDFNFLKLRAVRGAKPPYPSFSELAEKQAIFELDKQSGTVVGFFFPPYLAKINTPGYHLHFITQDKDTGGHILSVKVKQATVELMPIHEWSIAFPETEAYAQSTALTKDYSASLKRAFGPGIQFK